MIYAADRNTLVDDIADKIREMIFSGQIKPGEMLPSRKDLASQFGVGISTVHEAIQSLSVLGLVESRPGKGTWVRENALESVIHPSIITNRFGKIDTATIYEARLALEVALAGLAAEKATPEQIAMIRAALDEEQRGIDDDAAFVDADWDFHMAVAEAADNVLLESFYHLSRELLIDLIQDAIRLPRVKEEASQLHEAQAQAIADHDVERAREMARNHMLYVKERLKL